MLLAELKKLLHNAPFRIFLCLFLLAGLLSPVLSSPDRSTPEAYKVYEGQSAGDVLSDIDHRLELLDICQTVELAAQLPPDVARLVLESLVSEYDLTEAEMEAMHAEDLLRFTNSIQEETELLQSLQAQASRVMGYAAYLESIRTQEATIRNSILYRNNDYALTLAGKTAEEYVDLDGLTLPLADPTGVEIVLGTWIDDVLGCAVAALTALFAFLQERQEGMTPLIFSTRRGRQATFIGKTGLVALLGGASCVLFTLFRMGFAGALGDLSRPVQTIPAFYTSPYPISVGEMLTYALVQRICATVLVGVLVSLLSITLERSLALGIGALIAGIEVLCWMLIDSASVLQPLKYLSIPALFSEETLLGNAVFVKLFGFPVNIVHTSVFLLLLGGAVLVLLGNHLYANSHKALSIPGRVRKERPTQKLSSLFRLELGKWMIHQKGALLLILVIALQPRFYDSFYARITTDELRYLSVIKTVEGEYTAEKQESLLAQREELSAQLAQTADQLMTEELNDRILALDQVLALSDYLAASDEPVCYVYETGYEAMFGQRPIGVRYQQALISLALCLMLPSLFTLDKETGIHGLISTTAGAGKLRRTKWRIAMLLTVLVFFLCWFPEAHFIADAFDLSMWGARAISLQMFSELPAWIPIWMTVLGLWLFRLFMAQISAVLIGVIADRTGKYIPAVLLSGLALGTVMLLE